MVKLSKILMLFFLAQLTNGLYGMASALGTKDLTQVATYWISTILPNFSDPYKDVKLGKDIVAGKHKPWLTKDILDKEVANQLAQLKKISELGAGGGGKLPSNVAKLAKSGNGPEALATLVSESAVLKAMNKEDKARNLNKAIIGALT